MASAQGQQPPGRTVGLISDTHGLIRPAALEALRGVELVVHAGDVGGPEVLDALRGVAPVRAVRGNTDGAPLGPTLPLTAVVDLGDGLLLFVLHDLGTLDLDPPVAGIAAVVHGHSHRPSVREAGGVLYVNPGSAGHRRFRLPATVGLLDITPAGLSARIVEID